MKPVAYTIYWTTPAQEDLEIIIDFIAIENESVAFDIYGKIKNVCNKLSQYPNTGRIVPELKIQNIEIYRELIFSPWRIMYSVNDLVVTIHAVIDSRRDVNDALLSRTLDR